MKKIFIISMCIFLLCACGNTEVENVSTPSNAEAEDSEVPDDSVGSDKSTISDDDLSQNEWIEQNAGNMEDGYDVVDSINIDSGDTKLEYISDEKFTSDSGEEILLVNFTFTNVSAGTTSLDAQYNFQAFQNGTEITVYSWLADQTEGDINRQKEILDGVSINVSVGISPENWENPIKLRVDDVMAYDDADNIGHTFQQQEINLETLSNENVSQTPDTEIVFRDIPWGTNFSEINQTYGSLSWLPIKGENFISPSVDAVLLDDDLKGIDFEYNDINIIASAMNQEWEVAGYHPTEIKMYFAYTPVDGILTKTDENSALYGAQYIIEPTSLEDATNDLKSKISSLYGEPSKETTDSDIYGNRSTLLHWYGANDTELVLKSTDTSDDATGIYTDTIAISYAWRKGDELMQTASDTLAAEAAADESGIYGNSSVDGL